MAEVKLVLSWDIQAGKEHEYVEFAVGEFAPGLARLGVQITDVWMTLAGAGPQILVGGLVENVQVARQIMAGPAFLRLRDRLFEYVEDFQWRITGPDANVFAA